jgi:hypothetical protein
MESAASIEVHRYQLLGHSHCDGFFQFIRKRFDPTVL